MNFSQWFGFGGGNPAAPLAEMPMLFPLPILSDDFVRIDVVNIYAKILTEVAERSEGLTADEQQLLWDNCLASETADGLISILARGMHDKSELFIVLDKATKVLRKATSQEETQIKADYKARAESSVGIFMSFKNYGRTDMIKLFSYLEFLTIGALNKNMNVAKAVQLKINDLRGSVSLVDSGEAQAQAAAIVKGLAAGRDALLDAKDSIENAKPDLTATEQSLNLLNEKRASYLGLPASWITGNLNAGLGDSGQADSKAIERGLKIYFFSIFKPVCKALFKKELTFKSDDFQQLATALEALKTFEITGGEFVSEENKRIIASKLFGLPADSKGDPPTTPDQVNGARDVTAPVSAAVPPAKG